MNISTKIYITKQNNTSSKEFEISLSWVPNFRQEQAQ